MRLHVRKIQMQPQMGRGDYRFLIFEMGKLDTPLACLSEIEFEEFLTEAEQEMDVLTTED